MKSFRYYLLIVTVCLLPLIAIFSTPLLPHTHDGGVHLPRMAAYYKALLDGQVLPRWAGDLNFGYGLPLFNFIYQTPYLVSSLLLSFGLRLVLTFKLNLAISFVLAGVCMFLFAQAFFKDIKKALLVTIFYQFSPFRLVEMLIRGSLGEMYTYAFFPLVLYGLTKLSEKYQTKFFILTSISAGLLIISHNSISLMFFGIAALFALISAKSIKSMLFGGFSLVFGLLVSAFYWMPALFEHKYTYGDLFMKDLFRQHFPPLVNFFIPNFTNAAALQTGGISVQFGLFHVFSIIITIFFLFSHRLRGLWKKISIVSLIILTGTLFFMNKISIPIWEHLSILRQFQFSWRLLSIVSFITSILAVNYLEIKLFRKTIYFALLLVFVVATTAYYWKPALGYVRVNSEREFWDYPLNTTYFGETDVIWSAGPAKQYPASLAQVIDGKGNIQNIYKKSNLHTYSVDAATPIRVVDNTQYFPGWRAYVDSQKTPIEFQDQNWRGLITFSVPSGMHKIRVVFEESPVRSVADTITIVGLLLLGAFYIGSVFYRRYE